MSGFAAPLISTPCAAGCGWPLHPAAAAGGHTTHPGCDLQPAATGRQVVDWQCEACRTTGTADNARHGAALAWMHDVYACPATAPSAAEHALRLARRQVLTDLYPTAVPAYTAPYRRPTTTRERTPMPTPPMLAAALDLAAQGLPVFFLGRTKRPVANCSACPKDDTSHGRQACPCLTCHGFYAATRDPDRIAAMHATVAGGLLAIRTGAICDLAVIDIDPRNGGRIVPELMTPTRAVRTGSGGWHLYYRHPGGTLAAKLHGHPGIDVKADGGYVVAPPSIHPDTRQPYRLVGGRQVDEMPPPLIAACRPAEASPAATAITGPTPTTNGRGISSPSALLAAHLDAVARAPEGRRRHVLYGAARGVARMVAAGALTTADAWAALLSTGRMAGQSDRDIRAAIIGGFRAESVATEGIAA